MISRLPSVSKSKPRETASTAAERRPAEFAASLAGSGAVVKA